MGKPIIRVDHPDIHADSKAWGQAGPLVRTARQRADAIAGSLPTLPGPLVSLGTDYKRYVDSVTAFVRAGVGECEFISENLLANSGVHYGKEEQATQKVTGAGGGRGGVQGGGDGHGGHGGDGGDGGDGHGDKYHSKLEPGDPPTKDTKVYDRLETLANGLLEADGTRINAFDTNDAFDSSQETVIAYTDKDGKVHVISTNPGQGEHATDLTISFTDEDDNQHVVTTVDGQRVETTTTANGTTTAPRVIAQGTLDQMMAEAKEVNVAWTDDKGAEHVMSTDADQGGLMQQVVIAYADENGQQHMISNEQGIDSHDSSVQPILAPSDVNNPADIHVATLAGHPTTATMGGTR